MFKHKQLRQYIINPILDKFTLYSKFAEELLIFTCAAESQGGTYLAQVKGPALGIYQMEPNTHTDIWENFLRYRSTRIQQLALNMNIPMMPESGRLIYDLHYATIMARFHYLRVSERFPEEINEETLWHYYKAHYNTPKGKAKKDNAIKLYQQFVK